MVNTKKRTFIGTRDRKGTQPNDVPQPTPGKTKEHAPPKEYTLQQALTVFVRAKEVQGMRDSTISEYIRHIGYLTDYLTEREGALNPVVDDLDADVVREYIKYLLTEKVRYATSKGRKDKTVGLSVSTVNIRLRTLRTMCRFWHKEGITKINAMENIPPVSDDQEEEVVGLTDAEIDLVLGSFDESQFTEWRDKIIILLMLDTGLRPSEAIELTIERVDFTGLSLHVPSQVAKNRRNREVPISREIAKLIGEIYEESCGYFGETEHVFNTAYGDPLTSHAFRKRLNRLKDKLGLDRLAPNQLRHTFCRSYLLNGGDLFTLQKIVDHADIKTTRKYVQMNSDNVRSQHNKFSPVRRIYQRKK